MELVYYIIGGVVLLFILAFLWHGVYETFRTKPLISVLMIVFLFPVYLIWALVLGVKRVNRLYEEDAVKSECIND